jgi:hypothetical protein
MSGISAPNPLRRHSLSGHALAAVSLDEDDAPRAVVHVDALLAPSGARFS